MVGIDHGNTEALALVMTVLLDMLFPLLYAGWFAGRAFKYTGKLASRLAVPAIAVIPVDIGKALCN